MAYEAALDAYVARMTELNQEMQTKEFRKKTKKEKEAFVDAAARANPPPGVAPATMINPGPEQLEQLLEGGRWCATFVDTKMTTKQTPQGKKHQYSAMVMVGDLSVRVQWSEWMGWARRGRWLGSERSGQRVLGRRVHLNPSTQALNPCRAPAVTAWACPRTRKRRRRRRCASRC